MNTNDVKKKNMVIFMAHIVVFAVIFVVIFIFVKNAPEKKASMQVIPERIGQHLNWNSTMPLEYATGFSIDYYIDENGDTFKLITVKDEAQYLMLPDSNKQYEDIPKEYIVLDNPQNIYLVATQVMDMMDSIAALDCLKYSSLEQDDWFVEGAKKQMEAGKLLYAGKYSSPDYELIIDGECDLAIENTMIYHTPEVKEKLEALNIPVLVDRSSYEKEPLGRTEWVKLYGAITNHEKQAKDAFNAQIAEYEKVKQDVVLDGEMVPTVAFFYIASNGEVKVRKSKDYLPKMIEMAGGKYIFDDLNGEEDNAASTVTLQMEEFYQAISDVDYIIYNATIEGELTTVDDLIEKSALFENVKAVKEGNVYCTTQDLYQSSMSLGTMILDIHHMLNDDDGMQYIFKLEDAKGNR